MFLVFNILVFNIFSLIVGCLKYGFCLFSSCFGVSAWLVILPNAGLSLIYFGPGYLGFISAWLSPPRLSVAGSMVVQTSWPMGTSNGDAGLFTRPMCSMPSCNMFPDFSPARHRTDTQLRLRSKFTLPCLALPWYQLRKGCKTVW